MVAALMNKPAIIIADPDESGHLFRLKTDRVPIDCGQLSDDPGQGAHVDSSQGVMTPGWRQALTFWPPLYAC